MNESTDKRFCIKPGIVLSLVFIVVSLYSVSHHEMWRDELQAWMIAISGNSISELFANIKYEGHPPLWFIILYALKHLTRNPAAIQVVHVIIAAISVFVFTRYAPFTITERVLFVFGYFVFYEYNIISRNYAVGVLLLFCFLSIHKERILENNYVVLAIILFLLCRANVFATVLAVTCASYSAITLFQQRADWITSPKKRTEIIFSAVVFLGGLVTALRVMSPEPDISLYAPLHLPANFEELVADTTAIVSSLWSAYMPLPRFETVFWESNAISYLPLRPFERYMVRFVISLAVFIIITAAFMRKPRVLFFYLFSSCFVFFFYFVVVFRVRYIGHLYLIFIASMWLWRGNTLSHDFRNMYIHKFAVFSEKILMRYILIIILIVNFAAGVSANVMDIVMPFSSSSEAAAFIKNDPRTANLPIAGSIDYIVSPIAGYLNRPVYYLDSGRLGTFIIWDKKRKIWTPADLTDIVKKEKKDLVLVTSYPLQRDLMEFLHISELISFPRGAAYDEVYWIYMVAYISGG